MLKKLKQIILSHDLSHDLKPKKKYSEPKIQHYNYDMSRIWYVYFRFRNPVTGYLERMDNIYCSVTLSKAERLEYLKKIKSNLSDMLKRGFNPTDVDNENEEIINYSISEAFDFALNLKKQTQNTTTFTNYKSRIKKFETWLNQNGFEKRYISLVTKKVINNYLNSILEKTSARNRDNTRLDLSGLFQVLEDNEIIVANPVSKIKAVGSTPEKNKPFSFEQEKLIFEYIEKKKLHLLLTYIQHISWAFFRPVECNRLQIKDVDLHDKIYRIKTKTGFKIKIIPEILLNQLPDLSNYEPESFLFGFDGYGQKWDAKESNRRNQYNRLFLKVKKAVGIEGREYGFYSFRHTNITRLYNNFIQNMTPDEAESKLMTITQHSTKDALRKYLREINAYRPEDYSKHF